MATLNIPATKSGYWSNNEGTGCSGFTSDPSTSIISDIHTVLPYAINHASALEFDTSTIPALATITSVKIYTYAHSYAKSPKALVVTYNVWYLSRAAALSSPPVCGDQSLISTSEGTLNWGGTTGWKAHAVSAANLNLSGATSYKLSPAWAHLSLNESAQINVRANGYTGTTYDPYMEVIYTLPSSLPPIRTLMGVGR